jgi:hypothetical protein
MINLDNSHIGNYFTNKTVPGKNINPNALPLAPNNVDSAASKYNFNCNPNEPKKNIKQLNNR